MVVAVRVLVHTPCIGTVAVVVYSIVGTGTYLLAVEVVLVVVRIGAMKKNLLFLCGFRR